MQLTSSDVVPKTACTYSFHSIYQWLGKHCDIEPAAGEIGYEGFTPRDNQTVVHLGWHCFSVDD